MNLEFEVFNNYFLKSFIFLLTLHYYLLYFILYFTPSYIINIKKSQNKKVLEYSGNICAFKLKFGILTEYK